MAHTTNQIPLHGITLLESQTVIWIIDYIRSNLETIRQVKYPAYNGSIRRGLNRVLLATQMGAAFSTYPGIMIHEQLPDGKEVITIHRPISLYYFTTEDVPILQFMQDVTGTLHAHTLQRIINYASMQTPQHYN